MTNSENATKNKINRSCLLGEYCPAPSAPETTGWAMLALLRSYEVILFNECLIFCINND